MESYFRFILFLFVIFQTPNLANAATNGVFKLSGIDENSSYSDLSPLADLIGTSSIVGLGESHHTSGGFYQAKFRLIKYLVEIKGFRAVFIESPWIQAQRVSYYVDTCSGSPEQAIKGLFSVWQAENVVSMLKWICSFNQKHPDDKVVFFGVDIQQPWDDVPALRSKLDHLIPEQSDNLVSSLSTCAGVGYASSAAWHVSNKYKAIRNGTYEQLSEDNASCKKALDAIDQKLLAVPFSSDVNWASVSSIGLRAYNDQMFNYAMKIKTGLTIYNQYAARDRGMALVFQKMRELLAPKKKIALWAHNVHISLAGSFWDGSTFKSLGYNLREMYGAEYFPIGIVGYNVEINWPQSNKPRPASDSSYLDFLLHQQQEPFLLINMMDNALIKPENIYNWGSEYWIGQLKVPGAKGIPSQNFKAMLFLENSTGMVAIP